AGRAGDGVGPSDVRPGPAARGDRLRGDEPLLLPAAGPRREGHQLPVPAGSRTPRGLTMGRVGIGLVGCGLFGESHLQAYRGVPNAEVRAVFDTDRDRAERIAAEFRVPRVCGGLEELC